MHDFAANAENSELARVLSEREHVDGIERASRRARKINEKRQQDAHGESNVQVVLSLRCLSQSHSMWPMPLRYCRPPRKEV